MENTLYSPVNSEPRPRRDYKLLLMILTAFVMIAGFVFLTSLIFRVQFNYTRYKNELAHCIATARAEASYAVYEGDTLVSRTIDDDLCERLSDAGHGRPIKRTPATPPDITVDFGSSGTLKLWETDYADYSSGKGPEYVEGFTLLFEPADGSRYLIENMGSFESLQRFLRK